MQQRQSSQTATQTETVNYDLLKSKILTALNNRSNLEEFYTKIIINSSEYNSFGAFKTYLLNYNKALEDKIKVDYYVNQLSPKVIFTAIINGLYSLNNPSLNTFIIDVENQMKRLENDPAFSSTETPEINFIPIIPMTVTDTTRPQSVPKLPVASNITISTNKPENINVVSRTGPAPVSENIENKINLSFIVPKKDKKNIDEMGGAHAFIMEYIFSLFTTLLNLGVGGLTKLFEQLPLIKKPKETAEYLGDKFPALTVGGGITIAIKKAYNLIKNIKMKKDQTKFIFSFINNIKSIQDVKTMFLAIQSNTIYFDVLADQILDNIKDRGELEMVFGKDTLRQKVIETLMKSFINIKETNRLDNDFYEQTLTNMLVSLRELTNY